VQDPVAGAPRLEFAGMKKVPVYADTKTSGVDWSADGTTVVYGTGFKGGELWTHHQDDALPVLLQQAVGGWPLPGWSPHLDIAQSRIAFDARPDSQWIEQRTISPSGNGMASIDKTRSFNGGTENCWQPMDGSDIVKRTATYSRKSGWLVDVVRIPAGGGTAIDLTSTLSRTVDKQIIAWRHGMELP